MTLVGKDTLEKLLASEFQTYPFLNNGHLQTLAAFLLPQNALNEYSSSSHTIDLGDGDKIIGILNESLNNLKKNRNVLFVHGLAGSSESAYLIRISRRLLSLGFNTIRLNLRGCGVGRGLAAQPYHSGRSEDVKAAIEYFSKLMPNSKTTLVGFSLGGNICLKLCGEIGSNLLGTLDSLIAVSSPINLLASVEVLSKPKQRIYDRFFVSLLKQHVIETHRFYKHLPNINLKKIKSVFEFDENYTAPFSGFKDAFDYYAKASSLPLIERIDLPSLILAAADDPMIDTRDYLRLNETNNRRIVFTKRGGHLGFLSRKSSAGLHWMDDLIVKSIEAFHANGHLP